MRVPRKRRPPAVPRAPEPTRRATLAARSAADTYTDDEREFLRAVDDFKRRAGVVRPTDADVLAIAVALGYRKVAGREPPAVPAALIRRRR